MEPKGDNPARNIRLNGVSRRLAAQDIPGLLLELGYGSERAGIAVAINGEVVPRAEWPVRSIDADDAVEIVSAVQGG